MNLISPPYGPVYPLNPESCNDANFISYGTGGHYYDNLRCHQWRQSWHHDHSWPRTSPQNLLHDKNIYKILHMTNSYLQIGYVTKSWWSWQNFVLDTTDVVWWHGQNFVMFIWWQNATGKYFSVWNELWVKKFAREMDFWDPPDSLMVYDLINEIFEKIENYIFFAWIMILMNQSGHKFAHVKTA